MAAEAILGVQALLGEALCAADPVGMLRALAARPETSPEVRAWLGAVDDDGLRVAALLVAKLRFQRLLGASRPAAAWFAQDPASFTGRSASTTPRWRRVSSIRGARPKRSPPGAPSSARNTAATFRSPARQGAA